MTGSTMEELYDLRVVPFGPNSPGSLSAYALWGPGDHQNRRAQNR